MRKRIAGILASIILGSTVPVSAEVISGIAAIVNDEIITIHEVNQEAAQLIKEAEKKGPVSAEGREQLRKTTLTMLIDKKLVQQKIVELNIKVSEEEVRQAIEDIKKQNKLTQEALVAAWAGQGLTFEQYKVQLREQLERLRLMSQEVRAKIQVSEKEARDYYEANLASFSQDEGYRARHIFFRVGKNADATEIKAVMARAATVLHEARSGKDFSELARTYSDEASAKTDGGDLGSFKKGDMMPEIEATVIAMKPGEVSDLVSTPAGFHIIKLEEKIPAKVRTFEEVKDVIDELLYKKKSEERFNQWAGELRKGASIEIKQQ
ncbi:MAG TPA: peptidylprolyl isomerase [Geobacteraceae bacterium]